MSEQNKEKNCWFVRLGEIGQHDEDALKENVITIDFGIRKNPKIFKGKDHRVIREMIKEQFSDRTNSQLAKIASPINMFVNFMDEGDIVICPFKSLKGRLYVGKIVGDCRQNEQGLLTREVKWLVSEPLSRDRFQKDILDTFSTWLTIFRIQRPNAFGRIKSVATNWENKSFKDKGPKYHSKEEKVIAEESAANSSLKGLIELEIERLISKKFSDYSFQELVSEIFKAKKYEVNYLSGEINKNSIDVFISSRELGLDPLQIVAQVEFKDMDILVENRILKELIKKVKENNLDFGLFVSWQDFSGDATKLDKSKNSKILLWDREEILKEFLEVYPKLPLKIRTFIPLKSILIVDHGLDDDS